MSPTDHDPAYEKKRAFLIRCAELLHAHGTPAHRLERVMFNMGEAIGLPSSFLYTPTSVFASFGHPPSSDVHMLRISSGDLDLGKLLELDEVMEAVEHDGLSLEAGLQRLEAIESAPPRWSSLWKVLAFAMASGGAARLFGGGDMEMLISTLMGPLLFFLSCALPKSSNEQGLFEPLAAFVAAMLALLAAIQWPQLDDRVVTLATLIVLLPGLSLTTALIELATRHLVSGVSRLAGSAVIFMTILLGVSLAWRIGHGPRGGLVSDGPMPSMWSEWVALAITPFAFSILLEARVRELAVIYATALSGFCTVRWAAAPLGTSLAPLLGALVVGVMSNAYARIFNRPALVPLTPGILLLVPGSLGYRSLTSFLDREALAGMEWAFQTGMVAAALVGGILAANVIFPPRRVL